MVFMKFESHIFGHLLRAVPALLVTLGSVGVAQAQLPAPEIDLADCSVTANRTFRFRAGDDPDAAWNPRIKLTASSPAGTWSALAAGTTCDTSGAQPDCAGMVVGLKPGLATETEDFTAGIGEVAGTTEVLDLQVVGGGNTCSADFTFMATS